MIEIVTGPPGSGKTTYCREQQRQNKGSLIFDLDDMAACLNKDFEDWDHRPDDVAHLLLAFRDVLTYRLANGLIKRDCYVIVSKPDKAKEIAERVGAFVVHCDPGNFTLQADSTAGKETGD